MNKFTCSQCEFSFEYDNMQHKAIMHCPHCGWIFDEDQSEYYDHEEEHCPNFYRSDCLCQSYPQKWAGRRLFLVAGYISYEPCSHELIWTESEDTALEECVEVYGSKKVWDIAEHFSTSTWHGSQDLRLIF